MSATATIDLNVRLSRYHTYVGHEDVTGDLPRVGDVVRVIEPESGLQGEAIVYLRDDEQRLLYLSLDFSTLSRVDSTPTASSVTPD